MDKPTPNWLYAFMMLFTIPLVGAGIDIYVPSLPDITHFFNANISTVQLTVSVYLIGYGAFQLPGGVLSDSYGRKKVILSGLILFTLSSFFAAGSISIIELLIFRLLQGIGAAAVGAPTRAMLTDLYEGHQYQKMASLMMIAWAFGPILAPVIGGVLEHFFNWHAPLIFIGCYALFMAIITLIIKEPHQHQIPLSIKSTAINLKTIICHPIFLIIGTVSMMMYSLLTVFNVIGPYLIQKILNYSALTYGGIALILGVAWLLGNIINKHILHLTSTQRMAIGLFSGLGITLIFILWNNLFSISLLSIVIPSTLLFICGGMVFPAGAARCFSIFPKMAGTASATIGGVYASGAGIMSALASLLKTNSALPLAFANALLIILALVFLFITIQNDRKQS